MGVKTKFVIAAMSVLAIVGLMAVSGTDRGPAAQALDINKFVHVDRLHLLDMSSDRFFLLSNTQGYSELQIINGTEHQQLVAQLKCDQDFQLRPPHISARISTREFDAGRKNDFWFAVPKGEEARFLIDSKTRQCKLTYKSDNNPPTKGVVKILAESEAFPWLKDLILRKEECEVPGDPKLDQLSCLYPTGKMEALETPTSGFQAKVAMLLGQDLPLKFIEDQNPYAPIDFSTAPKLKAIFLSTLVYRSDFYGTVMARLLKHHAERGTPVFIITTQWMMFDKDKKLLFNLAKNGNVRVQEFLYQDPHYDLGRVFRVIDTKFRDMHVKLLITLSEDETRDRVVIGGRNIHDGFLFEKKPDYSQHPDLIQYGSEDSFVHWSDFEMKISSPRVANMTAAHFLRLWNRDSSTQILDPFKVSGSAPAVAPSTGMLQHFLSLPYVDDHALEKLYVFLIDRAKSNIKISSPYLSPPPSIMEALMRAADRGVEVTVQTRIELKGDTLDWMYEEVNKASINDTYDKLKLYQWKEDSILHSKFILVDGAVAFIGSVNLSRRSFIQDVESGYIIRSPEYVKYMENLFGRYLEKSARITEREGRKIGPSILLFLLKNQF